jgi:uncharacterized membrane protein YciS (DUF1049 family)
MELKMEQTIVLFFIGFCVGFLVSKIRDINIELENEKLKREVNALKKQIKIFKKEE